MTLKRFVWFSVFAASLLSSQCQRDLVLFAQDAGSVPCTSTCGAGVTLCADSCTCVALNSDDANCGKCGTACSATQSCAAGTCYADDCPTATCAAGQVCINDTCTDKLCAEVSCPAGQQCTGGRCEQVMNGCDAGGIENEDNCGGCGVACPAMLHASRRCMAGACTRGVCESGFFDVDGDATPGCESTCVALLCTLPDGGHVTLSTLPLPDTGSTGNLAGATNVGAPAANSTYRHAGTLGEGPGTPTNSANATHRNSGGLKSLQH